MMVHGGTCVELFAGAGGAAVGLRDAGFTSLLHVEWDQDACRTLMAAGFTDVFEGDVRDVQFDGLPPVDLLWSSPPCFPPGAQVTTAEGLRSIEDVQLGESVLTHAGRYRRVKTTMRKEFEGDLVHLEVSYGRGGVSCTPEHPFYVRRFDGRSGGRRRYLDPEWVPAEEIKALDLVLEPAVTEPVPYAPPVWQRSVSVGGRGAPRQEQRPVRCDVRVDADSVAALLGLYLSEGHLRGHDAERPGKTRREVVFSIAKFELDAVKELVSSAGYRPMVVEDHSQGASRVFVSNASLWALCREFGCGAAHKRIPEWVYGMPVPWCRRLLQAYFMGDGCLKKQSRSDGLVWSATTVSGELVQGLLRLITSAEGVVAHRSVLYRAHRRMIMGRDVAVRTAYGIRYSPVRDGRGRPAKVTSEGAWIPVRSVSREWFSGAVFNLEVEEDNSYTVSGIAVHNCQAFSQLGHKTGPDDARNGWPWTLEAIDRMVTAGAAPTWVLCENVAGLAMHASSADCDGGLSPRPDACRACYWASIVAEFGKRFPWVGTFHVDAADYGVPQRRERVFLGAGPRPITWPTPTHSRAALVHSKWVTGEYWAKHRIAPDPGGPTPEDFRSGGLVGDRPPEKPWVTVRDVLPHLTSAIRVEIASAVARSVDEASPAVTGRGTMYTNPCPGEVCRTETRVRAMRASVPAAESVEDVDPDDWISVLQSNAAAPVPRIGDRRRLTPEELARIQGFPPGYPFAGGSTSQHRQVGNAVPPPLARALAEAVVRSSRE